MLTLIDNIKMPAKQGIEKINPRANEPKYFWIISIMLVRPTENKAENIKEYPIR
tara:strand:+ start:4234 stop:4395 length:162 start_codon:yes stop_codon:yes gene_type:complete